MQLSIQDIQRHSNIVESIYSPNKDSAAFELSLMKCMERGLVIEKWVAEFINDYTGYRTSLTVPNAAWDITMDMQDKPVRIEVKSSMVRAKTNSLNFFGVKPDSFEYIFFGFVMPTGIQIKWATVEGVKEYCKGRKYGRAGYTVIINDADNWDEFDWMYDLEDFPYNSKDFA